MASVRGKLRSFSRAHPAARTGRTKSAPWGPVGSVMDATRGRGLDIAKTLLGKSKKSQPRAKMAPQAKRLARMY